MSELSLWERLKTADLVTGEQPEAGDTRDQNLWYVRVLQGFAGWLAAIFMLAFLGFGVAGLFDHGQALIVMGVVINFSTYLFFKTKPESDFFEQMVLAFSLTGQLLFTFGLLILSDFRDHEWLFVVGLYQAVLARVIDHYVHRFLCTWFAVIAAFWGFEWLVNTGLGSALVAAGFVWIWLNKTGWENERDLYEPMGYGLALSIVTLNVQSIVWFHELFHRYNDSISWVYQHAPLISALLNSAVLLYFVYRMAQEQGIDLTSTTGKWLLLAAIVLLFSAMPVVGLSSALLVLLVGFARQKIVLMVMGALALLGFVSWFYYSLAQTLLVKSLILIAIGVVLTIGYALLRHVFEKSGQAKEKAESNTVDSASSGRIQKIAASITLALALIGVNHAIVEKENTLKTGKSVFLELAPVDPRSIMQGDFMRLRFDMANKISANEAVKEDRTKSLDGYAVVDVDEKGVGTFNAIYDNQSLTDDQVLMQFRKRNGRIQFATNAFFFQEGDAKLFDAAKFGEFKVAANGELLLKAMYDQDLKLLGENRLD